MKTLRIEVETEQELDFDGMPETIKCCKAFINDTDTGELHFEEDGISDEQCRSNFKDFLIEKGYLWDSEV